MPVAGRGFKFKFKFKFMFMFKYTLVGRSGCSVF
jgi:hypothetical protein